MSKEQKNILIVEDEATIAMLLEHLLLAAGYDVCGMAMAGNEAIEMSRCLNPDMIMMDIKIKGDMDGIETARAITSTTEVPIIFLSAFSDEETRRRAADIAHYGFFRKPFKAEKLLEAIENAFVEFFNRKSLE